MATELTLDLDNLTLGDLEHLEEEFGADWVDVLSGTRPPAKLLLHVAWRLMLHSNPEVTLDEVRGLKVSALGLGADADDEPVDPTSAA